MKRIVTLLTTFALAFAIGCSREEAENAAAKVEESASEAMNQADDAAKAMADTAKAAVDDTKVAAADLVGDAVAECRHLAETGAWDEALEVCRKAHEMMPDDLALEHAYQQAQAAATN